MEDHLRYNTTKTQFRTCLGTVRSCMTHRLRIVCFSLKSWVDSSYCLRKALASWVVGIDSDPAAAARVMGWNDSKLARRVGSIQMKLVRTRHSCSFVFISKSIKSRDFARMEMYLYRYLVLIFYYERMCTYREKWWVTRDRYPASQYRSLSI